MSRSPIHLSIFISISCLIFAQLSLQAIFCWQNLFANDDEAEGELIKFAWNVVWGPSVMDDGNLMIISHVGVMSGQSGKFWFVCENFRRGHEFTQSSQSQHLNIQIRIQHVIRPLRATCCSLRSTGRRIVQCYCLLAGHSIAHISCIFLLYWFFSSLTLSTSQRTSLHTSSHREKLEKLEFCRI